MSHPLCWPQSLSSYSRSRFHPLGQSPAISLTQDLSPEQSATILSLECNDIYNVLFTLQADLYVGPGPRKMDITCSASETAILARNILAFTLIHDGTPVDQIWNLYYHFKLDAPSAELLTRQSQTLADASTSHGSWDQSPYCSFIKVIGANTLAELHKYWTLYAQYPTLSSSRVSKLQSEQKKWSDTLLRKLGPNCNAAVARSTTLIWAEAAVPVSNQFKRYLRTGTTSTQVNDLVLNPTWIYSSIGENFDPASSSFPMSFHLVSAFLPGKGGRTTYIESPLDKAKEQFQSGCKVFKKSLEAGAITLRFYAGDALPFCQALAHAGADPNQTFTWSWHAQAVDLFSYFQSSPLPPHQFDVIDTSRLGDTGNLGLINILLATYPLRATRTSPVYTEVNSITEEAAIQLFIERISTDVPCFSLFMGLVPRAYASGFDSQSAAADLIIFDTSEYWQRAVWTDITTSDPNPQSEAGMLFSVNELADALFSLCRQMHFYDNPPEFYAPASLAQRRTWSELNVTRETVALFFRHIQTRGRVSVKDGSWEAVATNFLKLVEEDTITYDGSRHREDMQLQLGLVGILPLQTDELSCVVLSIPSSAKELNILREYDEMTPPRLSCALRPAPKQKSQIFSSIHATWGELVPSSNSDQLMIEESPEGTANLIISFWAPTKLVQPGTEIELVFRYTPLVLQLYQRKLGSDYTIFKAKVGSGERVKVLKARPAAEGTQRAPLLPVVPTPEKVAGEVGFEVQGEWKEDRWYIKSITGRLDISSEEEKQALKDGAKVEITQVGPCTLQASVGGQIHKVVFEYPIREKNVKLRIARKSAYIEMIADPYKPLHGGLPHTHLPGPAWNMHRIALDAMPIINVDDNPDPEWVVPHMSLQHSDHERAIMRSPFNTTLRDKLHALKVDVNTIVHDYVGFEARGGPFEVFALAVPGEGVQAIVLVGSIKIDLANGTFLLDAGVIPVCPTTKGQVLPLLDPIGKAGVLIMSVDIKQGEMGVFKEYLAACVERCRTWSHRPDCSKADSFLCTCGQGIGFTAPEWNLAWWTQLFPHATRAAISPVFSVAYLELVAGDEFKDMGYGRPPPSTTPLNGCWACAKSGVDLSACGKCKRARYCSSDCQKGHWKDHKKTCGK